MDYRNSESLTDDNTIFYGHNLVNKTAFGSLENVFLGKWLEESNHYVVILTEYGKSVYEIFSVYTIEPELYYLQTSFEDRNEYKNFLNTLKDRSIFGFNVDLQATDKIITLSTCTSDNKNRNVVHAKLVQQ